MNRYVAAGIQEVAAQLPPSFEAFQAEARAAGCDEALVREWQPNAVLNAHTHPFDAEAIVVRGELLLTEGGRTWHLGPGATLCGCVKLGTNVMIGAGAVVLPRINIGTGTIVGAGSVVTRDLPAGVIAFGNPARIRHH